MVKILGAKVDSVDMISSLCFVESAVKEKHFHHIITLNAEIIYQAQKNQELMGIINQADLVTPDGYGVIWAANKLGQPLPDRVTGIDLLQEIAAQASKNNWRLYFLGSAPPVVKEAVTNLRATYKGIDIVGFHSGYFTEAEEKNILEDINEKQPDILIVALGAPKQEFWINNHRDGLKVSVAIGVGGSLDVIAGKVKRAPAVFQKLHLEWLWRVVLEPKRIGRIMALPKFMLLVLKSGWQKNS